MSKENIQRGTEELDKEQVNWRVLKLKTILGITGAGPFMYSAQKRPKETVISYFNMAESLFELTKGPIYVHYYRGGITKVSLWAFEKYWGGGQYYCTLFDDSLSWFVFIDDNSENNDRSILVQINE